MKVLYVPSYQGDTEIDKYFINKRPETLIEKNPDIVFVSGGDGSMLQAIHDYSSLNVPFFGIAAGTLNFLMNSIDCYSLISKIDSFKYFDFIDTRSLKIRVERKKTNGSSDTIFEAEAANDIVLGNKVMDYNHFNISGVKKEPFISKGLGMIISTPLGSTAFYINNGGKIIEDIESKKVGVSSIVASIDSAFDKQISLKKNKEISVELMSDRTTCAIYIDGKVKIFQIQNGDQVFVQQGKKVKLAFLDINEFLKKRINRT